MRVCQKIPANWRSEVAAMTKAMITLAAIVLLAIPAFAGSQPHEICLTDGGRALAICARHGESYLCNFDANPRGSDKGTETCYKRGKCFACDASTLRY